MLCVLHNLSSVGIVPGHRGQVVPTMNITNTSKTIVTIRNITLTTWRSWRSWHDHWMLLISLLSHYHHPDNTRTWVENHLLEVLSSLRRRWKTRTKGLKKERLSIHLDVSSPSLRSRQNKIVHPCLCHDKSERRMIMDTQLLDTSSPSLNSRRKKLVHPCLRPSSSWWCPP